MINVSGISFYPNKSEIDDIYNKVKGDWAKHLSGLGVILPNLKAKNNGRYYNSALQLVALAYTPHQLQGRKILKSKDGIGEFVVGINPYRVDGVTETSRDQQPRHLRQQKGWDIACDSSELTEDMVDINGREWKAGEKPSDNLTYLSKEIPFL